MIAADATVVQQGRGIILVVDGDVDRTVVVVIEKGGIPPRASKLQARSGNRGDFLEGTVAQIMIKNALLAIRRLGMAVAFELGTNVAVGDEDVGAAIVVIIQGQWSGSIQDPLA